MHPVSGTVQREEKDRVDSLAFDGTKGSKRAHVSEIFDSDKEVPHVGQELALFLFEPNPND